MFRPEYTFMLFAGTSLASLTGFALLYLKLNRISRQLARVSATVAGDRETKPAKEQTAFDADLLAANVKSMVRQQMTTGSPADRYRYLNSLASHGLAPEQIAQILEIGRGEAEQLVKLARLRTMTTETEEMAA